jgi:hypothetical protein
MSPPPALVLCVAGTESGGDARDLDRFDSALLRECGVPGGLDPGAFYIAGWKKGLSVFLRFPRVCWEERSPHGVIVSGLLCRDVLVLLLYQREGEILNRV